MCFNQAFFLIYEKFTLQYMYSLHSVPLYVLYYNTVLHFLIHMLYFTAFIPTHVMLFLVLSTLNYFLHVASSLLRPPLVCPASAPACAPPLVSPLVPRLLRPDRGRLAWWAPACPLAPSLAPPLVPCTACAPACAPAFGTGLALIIL